jgi:hypothetical protein
MQRADALGHAGMYDATLEGGVVSAGPGTTTSFARAEGDTLLATHLGAAGATLSVRGVGDLADDGTRAGVDGATQGRLALSLPLARAFASDEPNDPWVHLTEPRLQAGVLAVQPSDVLPVPAARGAVAPSGASWLAAAGWSNALGRWGARASAQLDADAGAVGTLRTASPALRARAAATLAWLALRADFARVLAGGTDLASVPAGSGGAFVARARLGLERGLSLAAHVAERDGVDPVLARALVDAPLEPASGFLAAPGWTGGARVAVPLGGRITTRAGADVDLGASELVAALGAIELHDPCGCVVVRASAAHRIGRSGVDAWVTVDLPQH